MTAKEAQSEAPSVYTILRELVRQAELAGSGNIYASDSLSLYLSDAAAKINRLIVKAKRDQIDEIIDIQGGQFNRWTQKDIAHFFERVGVIYRKLSNNLNKGDGE